MKRSGEVSAAQRTQKDFRLLSGCPACFSVCNQPFSDDAAAQLSSMAPEGIGVDGKLDLFFPALQLQGCLLYTSDAADEL